MAKSKDEIDPITAAIIAIIFIAVFLWLYVLKPLIDWFTANVQIIAAIGFLIFFGVVGIYAVTAKRKAREQEQEHIRLEEERRQKEAFAVQQRAKGLELYVNRFGEEQWGTQRDVAVWKKMDDEAKVKESLYYKVVSEIKAFKPIKRYEYEQPYHDTLYSFLTAKFPHAKHEHQRGASRPDIVIENIAIEVKGPTLDRDLETLTTKCLKYHNHYDKMIIVLFDPQYSQRNFEEISRGINQSWPDVEIIVKPYIR
jgi:hypothetical protein